eukprot:2137280-Karenia_brevis.AAC.1
MSNPLGPDRDCILAALRAYASAQVEVAPDKSFGCAAQDADGKYSRPGDSTFVAWGTEVISDSGTVGVPRIKRG